MPDFFNLLVRLNPAPPESTTRSHSDLPPYSQQPMMDRTKSPPYFFPPDNLFFLIVRHITEENICHYFCFITTLRPISQLIVQETHRLVDFKNMSF